MFILRPLQEKYCQSVVNSEANLLGLGTGQGKTVIAVEACRRLDIQRAFIVAPRNTEHSWQKTVAAQHGSLPFRRIDSSAQGKRNAAAFDAGEAGYYFVTWEFMRGKPVGYWDKINVDIVIADEIHRMQNRNSKSWANMKNVGKKTRRLGMSGTFTGNKIEGAWTSLRWCFPERLDAFGNYDARYGVYGTPRSFWNWVGDWVYEDEELTEKFGHTVLDGEIFEAGTMLSYYTNYFWEGDVLDITKPNEIEIYVGMTAEQKRMYKQLQRETIAWLKTPDPLTGRLPMVTEIPATTRMRLRQILLGEISFNDMNKVSYHADAKSPKMDAVIEELSDIPDREPVLLLTHSREFAVYAVERLARAGVSAFAWVGGTSDKQRKEALYLWGKVAGVQVIVAVIEAIAEGTDGLQDYCSEEWWVSESDNRIMNEQVRGRLPRVGKRSEAGHTVNRRKFIVPGTYDESIIDKQLADALALSQTLKKGQ